MQQISEELLRRNQNAFYVFDTAVLKQRIAYLREHLPADTAICYAVKANPFIVRELAEETERLEICSPGEADICTALGVPSEKMVISGVYKTPSSIEKLVSDSRFAGIFTAESVLQFRLLKELSEKYAKNLKVLLRLTNDSQFGMDERDIRHIVANRSACKWVDIAGIQYFSGTQKTSLKKYGRELRYLDRFLQSLKEEEGYEAQELEYGTGFPVSYFKGEESDEEALLTGFSELVGQMTSKPKLIVEMGRSIAASCGRYFTHIVDIKQNCGLNYALIDGGMHQLVYFGQVMAMKQPYLSVVGKQDTVKDKLWTICGALCTMNDIVVKQIELPDISVGDVLCFENAGAYCMTEGISLLLSRDLPAVYIQKEDGTIYRVRETTETKEINLSRYERM